MKIIHTVIATVLVGSAISASSASASLLLSGSSGNRAASANFSVVAGTQLRVVLTNIATNDITGTADLLTAVFLRIDGPAINTLAPVSAILSAGSIVHNGPNGGGNLGGEWAFASGGNYPGSTNVGIGSAGFNIFGQGNFNGPDLHSPIAVNGANYGITSAGDNLVTANGGLANDPIVKNSVTFTILGLPENFDLSRISLAYFQYGTSISEGGFSVPTPGAFALLGMGGLVMARRRR